ncbi:MAG: site-specific integrase [Phycisphaerae bacterium]|nr:site-specific integrase [Phycisphaerae bacterium]
MAQTRFRIPKLSEKPEPGKGVFYSTYRAEGKSLRKRFTRDREESFRMYLCWLADRYGIRSAETRNGRGSGPPQPRTPTLGEIVHAHAEGLRGLVIKYGIAVHRGTITRRVYEDNCAQAHDILDWCGRRFGDQLAVRPFAELMNANDYNQMMADFTRGEWQPNRSALGPSQLNKRRQRFWNLIKFARQSGMDVRLTFGPDDVRQFGGNDIRRNRELPTVADLVKLLESADDKMRLWMWMALGLGFGNDDLARCCPKNFDLEGYDMSRWKTGNQFARNGTMPRRVHALLQNYLQANPRQPNELLFATRRGRPLVSITEKPPEQILKQKKSSPDKTPLSYTRSDSIQQAFFKLQKKSGVTIAGGFYTLRVIAATAFAARPGVSLAEVKAFLGHGKSDAADRYMRPLTPQTRPLVEWVNRLLDTDDIEAGRR